MKKVSKSKAMRALEAVTGGPLTFGEMIWSIREGEEMSLAAFAGPLGISRQHLNDVEKGQRAVSPTRAAEWA
jgi:DNA-binding transcriptional regulator YiaG